MIAHIYSHYQPRNPETMRRMKLAQRTWAMQPWLEFGVDEMKGRLFRDRAGTVPYIIDIFRHGTGQLADEDIAVFTNADICVSVNCSHHIAAALQSLDAVYCFRRDFNKLNTPLPDPIIKSGRHYVGSDLYAFRVGWWRKYWPDFPDMLLGREAWDSVLRILINDTHPGKNCTLHNLIYHEKHGSTWENPANRRTLPSQLHNIQLARIWMLTFGHNPASIGI